VPRVETVFDVLYVSSILQRRFGNVARGEIHLFTYLSCLLSIYAGNAADDWGYGYAGTKTGSPFSAELNLTIDELLLGDLAFGDEFLHITEAGLQELLDLSAMTILSRRTMYLEAACCSILAIPVGIVRDALSQEPNLRPVFQLATSRRLLDHKGLDLLYEHFDSLRKAVGDETKDLLVPATVWLSYLAETAKRERLEALR
jgi:hypothetical protein